MKTSLDELPYPLAYEARPWPVSWSAAIAGALATIAAVTIFGLFGAAVGAGSLADIKDFSTWHEVSLLSLSAVIFGAFFANVIGGWVAGKIVGPKIAEPAILHAAIAWLITVPSLVMLLALGAGRTFGGWYGGLISSNLADAPVHTALALRHTATAAATSLLVGLIGSVIGGWLASGEPMSLTHYKTRATIARRP